MTVVITVAQQKGGAGKTTLAANLAAALAATRRVAVLDIDPQGSLARWHAIRIARTAPAAALAFSDLSGWRLAGELDRLRRAYDVVIVDSPPVIDSDARRAIRGADLVVVPVQPSAPDIWAAEGTLKLAASERRPACLVLNRAGTGSRMKDGAERELRARGLTVLPAVLGNRTAFSHAFAEGLGVTEAAPRSVAAAELRAVLEELLARVERPASPSPSGRGSSERSATLQAPGEQSGGDQHRDSRELPHAGHLRPDQPAQQHRVEDRAVLERCQHRRLAAAVALGHQHLRQGGHGADPQQGQQRRAVRRYPDRDAGDRGDGAAPQAEQQHDGHVALPGLAHAAYADHRQRPEQHARHYDGRRPHRQLRPALPGAQHHQNAQQPGTHRQRPRRP